MRRRVHPGADIAITCFASADKATEVAKELKNKGVQATAFRFDQAVATLAPQLIDEVVARFGGLDILVNNAAIGVEAGKAVEDPSVNTAALRPRPDARHQVHRRHRNHPRGRESHPRRRPDHQYQFGHRSPRSVPQLRRRRRDHGRTHRLHRGVARDLALRGTTVNTLQAGWMQTDMNAPSAEFRKAMVGTGHPRITGPAENVAVIAFPPARPLPASRPP